MGGGSWEVDVAGGCYSCGVGVPSFFLFGAFFGIILLWFVFVFVLLLLLLFIDWIEILIY